MTLSTNLHHMTLPRLGFSSAARGGAHDWLLGSRSAQWGWERGAHGEAMVAPWLSGEWPMSQLSSSWWRMKTMVEWSDVTDILTEVIVLAWLGNLMVTNGYLIYNWWLNQWFVQWTNAVTKRDGATVPYPAAASPAEGQSPAGRGTRHGLKELHGFKSLNVWCHVWYFSNHAYQW